MIIVIKTYLNAERHQNCISGSKVTAILLKGWVWPIGGASAVRVCNIINSLSVAEPFLKTPKSLIHSVIHRL